MKPSLMASDCKSSSAESKYTINSFFSGIGGFDFAFEKQGFTTQYLCEINHFCNQILSLHWPNVHKETDINATVAEDIPKAMVWCGGFPCQDISLARGASKRLGLDGARSGLFFKFATLIKDCLPRVVVIENVGGLFNSNQGRDFGIILQTLSSLGYGVAWRLLNSRYFGVPQSRTRVYLCCWRNNPANALSVMFDKEGAYKPSNERKDFITEDYNPIGYPKVPKVAYCLAASSGRHTGTDWSRTYVVSEDGVRRLSPVESERLQGFPDHWTRPDSQDVCSDNLDTMRYTAIGNAVTVPVVEWIADRIKSVANEESAFESIESAIALYADFNKPTLSRNDFLEMDFMNIDTKFVWSKGGIVWGNKCVGCNAYPTPRNPIESSLLPLIEKGRNKQHLYLTPNAAEGILRRVDHQNRTLFGPLRTALEKLKSMNTL